MNALHVLRTNSGFRNKFLFPTVCIKDIYYEKSTKSNTSSSSSSSSSDSSSDLEDKAKKVKKSATLTNQEEARNKLKNLLNRIVQEDAKNLDANKTLAKPPKHNKGKIENADNQTIKNAVKEVAKDIGGDVKRIESELLSKLLGPTETTTASSANLSDIVKGLKIDRESKPIEQSRAEEVRNLLKKVKPSKLVSDVKEKRRPRRTVLPQQKPEMVVQKIDLFGSEPLGIFTNKDLSEGVENKTYQALYQRDLKLAITHPPSNYFQQMILWTEQGKLWKFPIDNEQGWDEEKKVYFTEHIFLEEHLEPWCPPTGPLRHFMELVCVGLSKNHFLTVEAKKEHILWYKDYFEDKKKLLQEVGMLLPQQDQQKSV